MPADGKDLNATFEAMHARLTQLEDERAILDTLHRYGQAIDRNQAEEWASLFTEDGVFHCTDRAGATSPLLNPEPDSAPKR